MKTPTPPQVASALQHLLVSIQEVDQKEIDPSTSSWADIEKSVIKLLKGPFQANNPEHQWVALGLSGNLGHRLNTECQAFWFPNRESIEGAVMGFPEALIVMSPFGAVTDALMRAKLELLDETLKDVRNSLAKVKFSASAGPKGRLTPVDYARLFDPGFVSFVAMDSAKSNVVWEGTPERLIRDIQDACSRVEAKLPPDTRQQLENQLVSALRRLESGKPLKEQATKATRVVELMAHLFGSEKQTGAAPEELWQDIIFPLLHIGAPEKFPPLDSEEVELAKKGVEPLYLFVEVVPYMHSASDAGLLGEFDAQELLLPHPSMENSSSLRLIQLNVERLRGLLASFDAAKTKEAIRRFGAYVFELSGTQPPAGGEGEEVLMTALGLIEELQTILATNKPVCLRRTTEAEAASEGALVEVRAALNGPRIILA